MPKNKNSKINTLLEHIFCFLIFSMCRFSLISLSRLLFLSILLTTFRPFTLLAEVHTNQLISEVATADLNRKNIGQTDDVRYYGKIPIYTHPRTEEQWQNLIELSESNLQKFERKKDVLLNQISKQILPIAYIRAVMERIYLKTDKVVKISTALKYIAKTGETVKGWGLKAISRQLTKPNPQPTQESISPEKQEYTKTIDEIINTKIKSRALEIATKMLNSINNNLYENQKLMIHSNEYGISILASLSGGFGSGKKGYYALGGLGINFGYRFQTGDLVFELYTETEYFKKALAPFGEVVVAAVPKVYMRHAVKKTGNTKYMVKYFGFVKIEKSQNYISSGARLSFGPPFIPLPFFFDTNGHRRKMITLTLPTKNTFKRVYNIIKKSKNKIKHTLITDSYNKTTKRHTETIKPGATPLCSQLF